MPGHPIIQAVAQDADRGVQFGQWEELLMAQTGCDPAFRDLNGHFDPCVRRRSRTGGDSTAHARGFQGRAGTTAVP